MVVPGTPRKGSSARTALALRECISMPGRSTHDDGVLISVTSSPASDSWGFVGVVKVGDVESFRSIRAYPTPSEALRAAQQTLAEVLGVLMAGQEWRAAVTEFGHAPLRTELQFGLKAQRPLASAEEPPPVASRDGS
jgi:hypothetical protein